MNPDNNLSGEGSDTSVESNTPRNLGYLNQVTPLSKTLAAIIFIMMPFIGGYVGYVNAPEKVVEVSIPVVTTPTKVIEVDETQNVSPQYTRQELF